jgi:hypothetical protein
VEGNLKKPEFWKKRIAYYVMGKQEWKYADDLDTLANDRKIEYPASEGSAGDVFPPGELAEKPSPGAAKDLWTYEPLNTLSR